jgi:hypothetical protein
MNEYLIIIHELDIPNKVYNFGFMYSEQSIDTLKNNIIDFGIKQGKNIDVKISKV